MIQAVAERGYGPLTTRELAAMAGVSTRTLYDLFAGKEECFLETFDLVVDRAVDRIAAAYQGGHDWRGRLCDAFAAFTRELELDRCASRLVLVEALGAGPASLRGWSWRTRALRRWCPPAWSRRPAMCPSRRSSRRESSPVSRASRACV